MALEDLFKVVKARFGDEQSQPEADVQTNFEIPEDLLFKCPRCANVIYNEEFIHSL